MIVQFLNIPLENPEFIDNVVLSILCGVGIFAVYYVTNKKISVSNSFVYTLILLPPVSSMIATIAVNDLILVAGMLGALSIIRFRHSMKESKNLVFVFWAVTAGIACGLSFRVITALWCIIIATAMLLIHFLYGLKRLASLTIKTNGNIEEIENIIKGLSVSYETKYKNVGETSEILYELKHKVKTGKSFEKNICEKIMSVDGVFSVKFLEM
jgi:hypothetical protein